MNAIACKKSLGHLNMHYESAKDRPAVKKLLDMLGFTSLWVPEGYPYYHYVVDGGSATTGDNILYVMELPDALKNLYAAIRSSLKVGEAGEHPAVAEVRACQKVDPEFNLHLGVLYSSLEVIEDTVQKLQNAAKTDPDLKGRIEIIINRSRPGNKEVDERLNKSPVFGKVERTTYGFNGIQVFVKTDLFRTDPLGDVFVFELDYVFPGYPDNILSNPTGTPRQAA